MQARELISGRLSISIRFRKAKKPDRPGRSETPAKKVSLPVGLRTPAQDDAVSVAQAPFDPVLSNNVYFGLQRLRIVLVNEAGGDLMPYHIMGNGELQCISKKLPKTTEELLEVNGIGKMKCKKYGARILEVVAQIVSEHQQGGRDLSFDSINLSSETEGSPSKRQREVEDGWTSTRRSTGAEVGANYDAIENDLRLAAQANVQPLTTSRWENESNFFEKDDIYEDVPEGFLDW